MNHAAFCEIPSSRCRRIEEIALMFVMNRQIPIAQTR